MNSHLTTALSRAARPITHLRPHIAVPHRRASTFGHIRACHVPSTERRGLANLEQTEGIFAMETRLADQMRTLTDQMRTMENRLSEHLPGRVSSAVIEQLSAREKGSSVQGTLAARKTYSDPLVQSVHEKMAASDADCHRQSKRLLHLIGTVSPCPLPPRNGVGE
jgi:hypothetical protein